MVISWLVGSNYLFGEFVSADWWTRPSAVPSQPSIERDLLPTTVVHPTIQPTANPVQPTVSVTVNPTNAPSGGTPSTPANSSSSSNDPCASGKSYSGPYCGWSPDLSSGSSNSGGSASSPRIGGSPEVLGLSDTSGSGMNTSDIILLSGVLCLLLYLKSKIELDKKLT